MKKWLKRTFYFVIIILVISFSAFHFYAPTMVVQIQDNPQELVTGEEIDNFYFPSFDSLKLAGRIYPTPNPKGTIILIHGIRSNQNYFKYKAQYINKLGFNTVTLDLRAHGNSEGEYCTFGVKEKRDISSLIDYLNKEYNIKHKIGVWGQSLGGAVALQSTAYDKRISFCISESTFINMQNVVSEYTERYIGFTNEYIMQYLLYRSGKLANFDSNQASPIKAVEEINVPVLFVHGEKDKRINVSNARKLFNACKAEQKNIHIMKEATHTTVWQKGGEEYWQKVKKFINQSCSD